MMKDRPQMTAAEVMQYAIDNATLLSPTMGQFQEGDIGPQIEREIELCERNGWAPEKPAEILENPEYDVVYTSPMAKLARGESVKGFMSMMDLAGNWFKLTNDPRPLHRLNMYDAMPEIADITSVPPRWINDDEQVAAEQAKLQQQQDTQTAVDIAPAAASVIRSASDNRLKAA